MARRGLSGGDLARMLRSTQPTVWRTVTGKTRNPRLQRAIARALGVPLKEILAAPAQGRGGGREAGGAASPPLRARAFRPDRARAPGGRGCRRYERRARAGGAGRFP